MSHIYGHSVMYPFHTNAIACVCGQKLLINDQLFDKLHMYQSFTPQELFPLILESLLLSVIIVITLSWQRD